MTIEINRTIRSIAELLKRRTERGTVATTNVIIQSVERDATGQAYAVIATVDGIENQYVTIPYGAQVSPGMQITAINYGTDTNPYWVMTNAVTGFETPGIMTFTEDTVIDSASFGKGDALFGRVGKAYILYDASDGEIEEVSGSDPVRIFASGSGYAESRDPDSGSTVLKEGRLEDGSWGWKAGSGDRYIEVSLAGSLFRVTVSGGNILIFDPSGSFCGGLFSSSVTIPGVGTFHPGDVVLGLPGGSFPNFSLDYSGCVIQFRAGSVPVMTVSPSGITQLELAFWPSASQDAVPKAYVDGITASAPGPGYFHVSVGAGSIQAHRPLLDASGNWLVEENSFLLLMADER